MQSSFVYFLVFHGSRDPRSQRAAKQLTEAFRHRIVYAPPITPVIGQDVAGGTTALPPILSLAGNVVAGDVGSENSAFTCVQDVYLECADLPLHQQIEHAIAQLRLSIEQRAATIWRVIPVFLLPGTHVMQDIPTEIVAVQTGGPLSQALTVTPYLGAHLGLRRVLNERMSVLPMEAWILLAHGSRQAGANLAIEQLAEHVGAVTAYWSMEPGLAQRLEELSHLGFRRIGILPYFLFSGGITDAIAQTVSQLTQQLPHLTLTLTPPLEVNQAELADLLVDLALSSISAKSAAGSVVTGQDEA